MFSFEGERRRCLAMPLGGVGTGNLAICGDGSLRQWQIHNKVNHVGYVPLSFFAIQWMEDHRPVAKLLQTEEFWHEPEFVPPVTSSDHYVPPEMARTLQSLPKVATTRVRACYPIAELEMDTGHPSLECRMTAWNPLIPGDAQNSSWPVAIFEVTVRNAGERTVRASLLSTLQNAVGWDGASLIHGCSNPAYGGNRNRLEMADGRAVVRMSHDGLADDHPAQGELVHAAVGGRLTALPEWDDVEQMWNAWSSTGAFRHPRTESHASAQGRTWCSALSSSLELQPGASETVTFLFAWHFPNRYVDWAQWESLIPAGKSRFYLGNAYCKRGTPTTWLPGFLAELPELRQRTLEYVRQFGGDAEAEAFRSAVSSCVANLRTNVCLWTEDGRFYGFEGGHGASTWEGLHAVGGCCPMNCTHVWNYEQGLVQLWPELFRSMRDTDWQINLSPSGRLPHRVTLPVYVRKLWDVGIGGPENPALDGLFAGVLKSYQYGRGDREWLKGVWPQIRKAMHWVMTHADTEGDGVLRGEQPNTYDIHLYGPNTFIGSQYLAALRGMEEMAALVGDDGAPYRARFESGLSRYEELCFNGEYYVQRIPEGCDAPYQFGDGCASDQLLGQWWAHHLGLGYVLDPGHVRTACQAIFRRNFRRSFEGFKQEPRVFASDHDAGLLICTYDEGKRPKVPLLYSDEVWTGIEYMFAALCRHEGLHEEARQVVEAARARYDGRERNPFNEVECGDHYIRALSAWSLRG